MSGEFDRKATVVATALEALQGNEEWAEVIKANDLGFPYAYLVYRKLGTLNKEGKRYVEETYDFLLTALDMEDSDEFTSWLAMVTLHPTNKKEN